MWQKIKNGFRNFMAGRYGADQLNMAMLIVAILLSLVTAITGLGILNLFGLALFVICILRMFSRNVEKRRAENQKFLNFKNNFGSNVRQFVNRAKNVKKFKYFKCPQCGARLRLPRKVGEVTVTCGKCRHQFRQKA